MVTEPLPPAPSVNDLAAHLEVMNFEVEALRAIVAALVRNADKTSKIVAVRLLHQLGETYQNQILTGIEPNDATRVKMTTVIEHYQKLIGLLPD